MRAQNEEERKILGGPTFSQILAEATLAVQNGGSAIDPLVEVLDQGSIGGQDPGQYARNVLAQARREEAQRRVLPFELDA